MLPIENAIHMSQQLELELLTTVYSTRCCCCCCAETVPLAAGAAARLAYGRNHDTAIGNPVQARRFGGVAAQRRPPCAHIHTSFRISLHLSTFCRPMAQWSRRAAQAETCACRGPVSLTTPPAARRPAASAPTGHRTASPLCVISRCKTWTAVTLRF